MKSRMKKIEYSSVVYKVLPKSLQLNSESVLELFGEKLKRKIEFHGIPCPRGENIIVF